MGGEGGVCDRESFQTFAIVFKVCTQIPGREISVELGKISQTVSKVLSF